MAAVFTFIGFWLALGLVVALVYGFCMMGLRAADRRRDAERLTAMAEDVRIRAHRNFCAERSDA